MSAAMKTIAIKIMSTKKFINIDQRMEDKNMLGNISPWMKLKTLKDDEGNFDEIMNSAGNEKIRFHSSDALQMKLKIRWLFFTLWNSLYDLISILSSKMVVD